MAYTYHDLKEKTVAQLRDIAKATPHEAVTGYSQMNKDRLLPALCRALNIDMTEHHVAHGIDKPGIKAQMRELKQQRNRALEMHDTRLLHSIRRQLHKLNHQIRSHMD